MKCRKHIQKIINVGTVEKIIKYQWKDREDMEGPEQRLD